MKRIIVTGASGFIGRALTKELLKRGYSVWAVVRNAEKIADINTAALTVVAATLNEYGHLAEIIPERGFDAFCHLAWDGTFGESFQDYHRQLNNAACAADALKSAKTLECGRFLLAGTIVELEARHYIGMDGCRPRTSCNYGIAKLTAGMLCKTLAHQLDIPLNTAILASVYGIGDQSNMIQNALIRALLKGTAPKLVQGDNLYDWIYIDDVVSALIAIIEAGKHNTSYYVGHRNLQTFEELVTKTRDTVSPEVPLRFGGIEGKAEIDYSMIDRDALYRDTSFECSCDFAESIRKTAEWLRGQT